MADPTDDIRLPEPELDQPAEPDLEPPTVPAQPEPETEPEPEPPSEPTESAEAQLRRENRELREWAMRMQQDMLQRQTPQQPQQPSQPADPFANVPDENWRQSLRYIDQQLGPRIEARIQQMLQPAMQQSMEARTFAESALLHRKYPDFPKYEAQAAQARIQHYQATGSWQPLELAYLVLRGAEAVAQPTPAQVQRQQQTAQRRKVAARGSQPETATPVTGLPRGRMTPDQIEAMSDDQILDAVNQQFGIPRLRVTKRSA